MVFLDAGASGERVIGRVSLAVQVFNAVGRPGTQQVVQDCDTSPDLTD